MKRTVILITVCIAIITLLVQYHTSRPKYESIAPDAFAALIDTTDVTIVDVRTFYEFDKGHIPGTDFNIDVTQENFLLESQILLDKHNPITIYCRSGNRSKKAAKTLSKNGYEVCELSTGYNGWLEAGYKSADSLIVIDSSHKGLTIFYPQYKSIDLVCDVSSPQGDCNAIFCCPAAFTGEVINEFKHTNIAGHHVSGGELDYGYACKINTGAFVWYNGEWKFLLKDYKPEFKKAANSGGMAFFQNMIIYDFVEQPLFRKNSFQYRAICELNDKLCVIQSDESIKYREFVDMLKEAGVKHALYLDMGGWNHSWYRKWECSKPIYINNNPHKHYTNWLTFYK